MWTGEGRRAIQNARNVQRQNIDRRRIYAEEWFSVADRGANEKSERRALDSGDEWLRSSARRPSVIGWLTRHPVAQNWCTRELWGNPRNAVAVLYHEVPPMATRSASAPRRRRAGDRSTDFLEDQRDPAQRRAAGSRSGLGNLRWRSRNLMRASVRTSAWCDARQLDDVVDDGIDDNEDASGGNVMTRTSLTGRALI